MKELKIDADYIRGVIDARGYEADDAAVEKALEVWMAHLINVEDNDFISVMIMCDVPIKETEE